jgi:hypothetical protein
VTAAAPVAQERRQEAAAATPEPEWNSTRSAPGEPQRGNRGRCDPYRPGRGLPGQQPALPSGKTGKPGNAGPPPKYSHNGTISQEDLRGREWDLAELEQPERKARVEYGPEQVLTKTPVLPPVTPTPAISLKYEVPFGPITPAGEPPPCATARHKPAHPRFLVPF